MPPRACNGRARAARCRSIRRRATWSRRSTSAGSRRSAARWSTSRSTKSRTSRIRGRRAWRSDFMLTGAIGVLFDGLAYGMLLFLLSVGLSVTLGMMNFVNLAHCTFAMIGGYVTVTLINQAGWPFLATLPAAFIAAAAASVVLERVLYR